MSARPRSCRCCVSGWFGMMMDFQTRTCSLSNCGSRRVPACCCCAHMRLAPARKDTAITAPRRIFGIEPPLKREQQFVCERRKEMPCRSAVHNPIAVTQSSDLSRSFRRIRKPPVNLEGRDTASRSLEKPKLRLDRRAEQHPSEHAHLARCLPPLKTPSASD